MNPLQRIILLLLLALVVPLQAGIEPARAQEPAAESPMTFNFNDVEVATVIRSIAKITGRNFVIDPKVKGKVTIVSSQPMDADEMYGAFLSALQVQGFTAIEADGVTKIMPEAEAKQQGGRIHIDRAPRKPADGSVTTIYKLKHIEAEKLVAILRPLISPQSYIAAHSDSNTLIIADRAGNIDRVLRIVKRIDQSGSGDLEIIPLHHASAGEVVGVIEGLWPDLKVKGPTPSRLKMIADDRTNSILMSGEASDLLRAQTLIAHLDTPVELEGSTQVVFLRYAKAKDMVPILRGVEENGDPKQPKPAGAGRSEVNIQADENTNALVITAPPSTMKTLQAVIQKLDIQRVQLMIEAIIAEVSLDKGKELGVQWRATDVRNPSDSGVVGGTNFTAGTAGAGINALSGPDAASAFSGLSGFNMGFMDGSTSLFGTDLLNLGVVITALSQDADTNVLSTPSLVTLDNEEAEIVVGQNVPIKTGSYTNTGSTTPTNPFATYNREDVGVKLKVTPQINEGDTIRLDIEQEVSNLVGSTLGDDAGPVTGKRSIKTSVMVEDGRILVLGGLVSDDVQETVQRVPILGSIPILGWLFRYNKTTHTKKNLMVFLRPTILQDARRSRRITFDKYDYMRKLQEEYNREGISLMPEDQGPLLPEFQDKLDETPDGE